MEKEYLYEKLENIKRSQIEESLPLIFTNWEIRIIEKLLFKEELTKSEKEHFSRKIKKKIKAINALSDLYLILK